MLINHPQLLLQIAGDLPLVHLSHIQAHLFREPERRCVFCVGQGLPFPSFGQISRHLGQVEVLESQEVATLPGRHASSVMVNLKLKVGGKDFERSEMPGRKARKTLDELQYRFYRKVINFTGEVLECMGKP